VLEIFDVMGFTNCSPKTACGFVKDLGPGTGKLWMLKDNEVPEAARYENVKVRPGDGYASLGVAPELTSFGVGAVEIDPKVRS
jgi:hypothetical protein